MADVLCVTDWNNRPSWLTKWLTPGAPLPLIGPPHSEPDSFPPDTPHYHVDWRYLDQASFEAAAYPNTDRGWVEVIIVASRIAVTEVLELPQLRSFPEWPLDLYGGAYDAWYEFQDRFKGVRLDCGQCPHMGFDLSGIAPDEHGRKQCPLHGLRFHPDGELDYREKPKDKDIDTASYLRFAYAELGRMQADRGLYVPGWYRDLQREIAEIHLERVRLQTFGEMERARLQDLREKAALAKALLSKWHSRPSDT